jgi:hypothetical protein
MPNRSAAFCAVVFLVGAGLGAGLGGCGFGQSGIEPPVDRIFLPAGLAADPGGQWLYAVNSNSDLRFNAGTVVAIDANRAAEDLQRRSGAASAWSVCPNPGYLPDENSPGTCCWDFFDNGVLNCDDRLYVDRKATVRIGSFGGNALVERRTDLAGGATSRLYLAVRSEPSVTFIDLAASANGARMVCDTGGGEGALCDDAHKIRGDANNGAISALKLIEEPHAMALDPQYNGEGNKPGLGLLYVGHLLEGLSMISTCNPAKPELLSVNRRIFYGQQGFSVTSVLVPQPGNKDAPVVVTGRNYNFYGPGEVHNLKLRGIDGGCESPQRTGAELVESNGFYSSAFYSAGSDIRGMVVQGTSAYLLHRNATVRQNPPTVVEIDQSLDAQNVPFNRAVAVVETCAGATEMVMHDAGRGPRLYVVCFEAGQIYVLDPSPLSVVSVINVGRGPTTLVFSPTDPTRGYVLGFSDNNISVIDLAPTSATENRVIQRIGFPQLRKR